MFPVCGPIGGDICIRFLCGLFFVYLYLSKYETNETGYGYEV